MRVLFLTAFLPHIGAAAEKNTKFMLEDLSRENQVDVVYFRYGADCFYSPDSANIAVLNSYLISTYRKIVNLILFPFLYPLFTVRFNWLILNHLKKIVNRNVYDVIICDHSQMFLYGKMLGSDTPKILLAHDVIAQRVQRSSNKILQRICLYSEKYCIRQKNTSVFSLCQKDCELIRKFYGVKALVSFVYLDPKVINATPANVNNYYVFIGKWSREDNLNGVIWFIKNVVPLLDSKIVVKIIGKNFPTKYINGINSNVSFELLGFVKDPYPIIANAKALLAPLFTGAGIKVKVVEALACGTPVVGTSIAFEGISDKYSEVMLLAEEPYVFANTMQNIDFSLNERIMLKNDFISDYLSTTIPKYIKQFK